MAWLTIDAHVHTYPTPELGRRDVRYLRLEEEAGGHNGSIDDTLAALMDDFGTNPVGTLAVDLTDEDIRTGVQNLGDANAPVTVIEFGDFQCPYCAKFYKEIEVPMVDKYVKTGKVKMTYKPLAFLDDQSQIKESQNAVSAVKCAQDQGKFWEYHDAIFETEYAEVEKVLSGQLASNEGNGNLNRDLFQKIASDLKMNVDEFLSCYDSQKHQNDFQAYINEAQTLMPQGISTPAVFVNGQQIQLSMNSQKKFDFNAFSAAIDAVLKAK